MISRRSATRGVRASLETPREHGTLLGIERECSHPPVQGFRMELELGGRAREFYSLEPQHVVFC